MSDMTHNPHEHNLVSEMLTEVYMDRFINRLDIWGKQWVSRDQTHWGYACEKPDKDTQRGRFPYEPVTPGLVRRLFVGRVSCAWSATDRDGCSRWLCFDSDTDDGALDRLESFLKQYGWRVIREGRRKGRDGHLWVLFDAPVPAGHLIILGNAMMRLTGVSGIECFPKTATGYSQVRGPLGINLKPEANGARGWFDGVEHELRTQLEWLAAQPLNRAADAIRESEKHRPKPSMKNSRRFSPSKMKGRLPIFDYVQARHQGASMVAQCPLCANEGHDQHQNNLRIALDGSVFCCVYGGPNQIHKVRDIISALIWR